MQPNVSNVAIKRETVDTLLGSFRKLWMQRFDFDKKISSQDQYAFSDRSAVLCGIAGFENNQIESHMEFF